MLANLLEQCNATIQSIILSIMQSTILHSCAFLKPQVHNLLFQNSQLTPHISDNIHALYYKVNSYI